MRIDGLTEASGKIQDKLAALPLVPLNSRLRKHRDKVTKQLIDQAKKDGCYDHVNIMVGC